MTGGVGPARLPEPCRSARRRAPERPADDDGFAFDARGDVRPLAEVEAEMIRLASPATRAG